LFDVLKGEALGRLLIGANEALLTHFFVSRFRQSFVSSLFLFLSRHVKEPQKKG
jgi:hypothetical protein